MRLLLLEIRRFLTKHIKTILITSIILTTVLTGMYLLNYNNSTAENEETGNILDPALLDDNAYFMFYVEDENQLPFTNTVILNQYIRLSEILSNISEATDTELLEAYKEQEGSLVLDPIETVPVIEMRRDPSSHLLTFYARLEDPKDNLKIAHHVYEKILNNEIPFLENKEIYILLEPTLFQKQIKPTAQDIFSVLNTKEIVIVVAVLFILSSILSLVINLLREFFSKTLNYSFTYNTDESTEFLIYSEDLDNEYETIRFLSAPGYKNKLIITESELPKLDGITTQSTDKNLTVGTTNLIQYNQLDDFKNIDDISEVIIVVVTGETSRKWFNQQERVSTLYNKPVKVLQISR